MRLRPGQATRWAGRNAPLAAALGCTALVALLYLGHRTGRVTVPGLDALELGSIDVRFRLRGPEPPHDDRIVVVGLDDETRRTMPELIQTRRGWARLIDRLGQAHPLAIGIDAFFSSAEINLPADAVADVRAALAELGGLAEPPPAVRHAERALARVAEETRGDDDLGDAIGRAGRVYLSLLFDLPGRPDQAAPAGAPEPPSLAPARFAEAVDVAAPRSRRPPAARSEVYGNLARIAAGARGAGHVNVVRDDDGLVRRVPLVIERAGRFYMPLGLALYLAATGASGSSFVVGERAVEVDDARFAVDDRAVATLRYRGPEGAFPMISAAAFMRGEVPAAGLAGKLVLVGYTDAARDKVAQPFSGQMSGVEVHATLLDDLLAGQLMVRAPLVTDLAAVLIPGLLLSLLQLRRLRQRRAWLPAAGAVALAAAYLALAQLAFGRGLELAVIAPLAAMLATTLAAATTALATEGREKARLRAAFSQYVHGSLVERILDQPDAIRLGGERRELTVLFSDIRGFSGVAEQLAPEALTDYLNAYLSPMSALVMEHHGMLDKYIGDAIMAVYGAPLALPDHPAEACETALAMIAGLAPLNQRFATEGRPPIAIGIGINTGAMAVGNMGSDARFDYTVMGDAVNLAARLESLTREYRVGILVGEATARAIGARFVTRELDHVRVKGRSGTARVFELVGRAGTAALDAAALERWAEALATYRAGDFAAALTRFEAFAAAHPDDGPAQVFAERARRLAATPPPAGWDGVFEQTSK